MNSLQPDSRIIQQLFMDTHTYLCTHTFAHTNTFAHTHTHAAHMHHSMMHTDMVCASYITV